MGLVERLEALAKQFDLQRWKDREHTLYDVDAAESSDMIAEAAKRLRELEAKCPS